jgi:hypothetical protein
VDNAAPETAPVGDVETFCTPECTRKAARKFEKNGRLLDDMLSDYLSGLSLRVLSGWLHDVGGAIRFAEFDKVNMRSRNG